MAIKNKIIGEGNVIKIGFEEQTINLRIDQIMPLKLITDHIRSTRKYQQIVTSIREVGIIEPPVVTADPKNTGHYILLDGHSRLEALKEIGVETVTCLVSTDDESFTYNKHLNRLAPIQEHRMIMQAVVLGVPEQKIADALGVNVKHIIHKRSMLVGICAEAIDILKDKMMTSRIFYILKKMTPLRQIEAATLMTDSGIYTLAYAKALLAATPKSQLLEPEKPKALRGLSEDQMSRMETEMASLQREYQLIEETYGSDILNLTLAKGYITSLLANAKIVRYLAQNHPEFLGQFQKIVDMTSLGGKETTA